MLWVSLHALFFSCHFCLLLFVFFSSWCSWKQCGSERRQPLKKTGWRGVGGEGAAPPRQMHWVSLHVLFFLVIFCLLLVFFLRVVLGSNVAVRGGNLLVSAFFFCDGAGDFLYQFPRTLAALAGGWGPVANTGRLWSRLTSRELYQHRPQIAQANSCVINVEKDAAENGASLWPIFSRNGTQQWLSRNGIQQWHLAMALASIQPWHPQPWHPSNGTPAMAPQQWHPAVAPSNGTDGTTPAMAPSNGAQWHPATAPNVNPAKVGSQPPSYWKNPSSWT